ncbi:MAG: hypothetical protein D6806_13015 [Deltaproteobacteria bacterium]|nr:MAG: hypothetical protein D6806_13015 [Deltaproteobacteria bacterium]
MLAYSDRKEAVDRDVRKAVSQAGKRVVIGGLGLTSEKRSKQQVRDYLEELYGAVRLRSRLYRSGVEFASKFDASDLSDVLYLLDKLGLGEGKVIQESNGHVVLRVSKCTCCEVGGSERGCDFTAGFIAGALMKAGKPESTQVSEVACGEHSGTSCVFVASW